MRQQGRSEWLLDFKHHQRRNNKINRRRIETLRRRARHIENRASSFGSASYDEAELAALEWVIHVAEQWIKADPYWTFVPSETGPGGHWRELGFPYYDRELDEWFVQETPTQNRLATSDEILQAQKEAEERAEEAA